MNAFRRLVVLVLAAWWLGCGVAHAEKRVALVIGNSAYKTVPRLTNPVNDAQLVAAMFKSAGFDVVTTKLDVTIVGMRMALREFGAHVRDADVAVVYYAGHGIELDGTNYLIPTDAILESDTDVLDEAFPLDRVLFAVEPAKQLRLIILDACRDNPFAKAMKRTIASRGLGRGLAKVEPNSPNTMIAFAAKAGSTASDGDSKDSPFATALVEHLPKPGLDLRKAFGFVRDDVLKTTNYQQEPYVYGSLGGDDVPIVPSRPIVAAPQPSPQQNDIRRDYELAIQLGTRDGWNAFLAQYPEGFYANLAKGQLNKIAAEEARTAAAEKARLAEEEKARLAALGAQKAEQEKAAAAAKAAEEARLAADKAKQIAQARTEAAEQQRKAAELAALQDPADRQAVEKTSELTAVKAIDMPPATENQKVAALPPQVESSPSQVDLPKALQMELRRVGCLATNADGTWNNASQHSLALFNKYAGTKFDATLASQDALEGIKAKPSRVCPLICDHGYKREDDRCVKITCSAGSVLNGDNECERQAKPGQPSATSKEKSTQSKSANYGNGAAIPEEGSSAVAAAAGGGCSYDACLARCHRNTGPGSTVCTPHCSAIVRNFALYHKCEP
jgi:Caspase domain